MNAVQNKVDEAPYCTGDRLNFQNNTRRIIKEYKQTLSMLKIKEF